MTELVPPSTGARAGRVAASVVAALAVMFSAAAPAGAAAASRPTLSVVPATGLQPGAQVGVAGAGFPPGAALQVDECELPPGSAPDPSRCTPVADSLLLTAPDGSVQGTATVVDGPVGAPAGAQCPAAPPATCVLTAATVGAPAAEAVAPITFGPDVAVP